MSDTEYHKIHTVFKRSPEDNYKTLLYGEWTIPEFDYLQDNIWEFTEKLHGTNIRVVYNTNTNTYEIKGKTDKAEVPPSLREWIDGAFVDTNKLASLFTDQKSYYEVVFYGEGVGPKIQKGGGNYGSQQHLVLFDIRVGPWWLSRNDIEQIAREIGVGFAPVFGWGSLHNMVTLCEEGIQSKYGEFAAEGIVARPQVEMQTSDGSRIITKLKTKDFPPVSDEDEVTEL